MSLEDSDFVAQPLFVKSPQDPHNANQVLLWRPSDAPLRLPSPSQDMRLKLQVSDPQDRRTNHVRVQLSFWAGEELETAMQGDHVFPAVDVIPSLALNADEEGSLLIPVTGARLSGALLALRNRPWAPQVSAEREAIYLHIWLFSEGTDAGHESLRVVQVN